MTHCPVWAQPLIHEIVVSDEGGWKLHSDPNDPDGGWTFGGVTASLWKHYYPQDGKPDLSTDEGRAQAIAKAQHIYWKEFVEKLSERYTQVTPWMLSCGVNLGLDDVHRIQAKIDDTTFDSFHRKAFCSLWAKTYIDMVQANAEAWKTFADKLLAWARESDEFRSHTEFIKIYKLKPSSLRARYLEGWLNRVNRYSH